MLTQSRQHQHDYQENLKVLNQLPSEIWEKILSFLPTSDRRNFRRVSRGCCQIINGNEKLKREFIYMLTIDSEELTIENEDGREKRFNDFSPITHIFQSLDIKFFRASAYGEGRCNELLEVFIELLKAGNSCVEDIGLDCVDRLLNLNEFLWLVNPRKLSIDLDRGEEINYVMKIPPGCEDLGLVDDHYFNKGIFSKFDLEAATKLKRLALGDNAKWMRYFEFLPQSAGYLTNQLLDLIHRHPFYAYNDEEPNEELLRKALEIGFRMSGGIRYTHRLALAHEPFAKDVDVGVDSQSGDDGESSDDE